MNAVNQAQPDLVVVRPYVVRRNQEAMANTAKIVSNVALESACNHIRRVAVAQIDAGVAGAIVPVEVRDVTIEALDCGLNTSRESIQGLANQSIDSNVCYGSENSCISKTTTWINSKVQ